MDGVVNSRMYGNSDYSSNHPDPFPPSSSSHVLKSLWIPNSSPSFNDPSIVNFDDYTQGRRLGGTRRSRPAPENDEEDGEDDGSSETEGVRNLYRQPEKKRRLMPEQVKQLEKSFEADCKLEPERKIHLAKELGLQPRQVAIWFQNRRARFKTKQIEKEYDSLKANYDSLKADFDSLLIEKERLQKEVSSLTNKLKQNEISGLVDPVQLEEAVVTPHRKLKDANSAKSDVFDSESPHCTEGNYTSAIEAVTVKPEWSELSPEVEETRRSFRAEAEYGFGDVFGSSCNLGLTGVEDQSNYCPWLC